jgi:hypothetical protein
MTSLKSRCAALVAALALGACSSSSTPSPATVNLDGEYTGNIVNGKSSCPGNWQVGESTQVSVNAMQDGNDVSLDVTGGTGLYIQVALGASTFNGTVAGSSVNATLHGTASTTLGNCTFSWQATFAGSLSDDTLNGTVTYTPKTNGASDCTAHQVEGCSEVQSFDGVRPATP